MAWTPKPPVWATFVSVTPKPPVWATLVSVTLRKVMSHAEPPSPPLGCGTYGSTYFMGVNYFLLHLFICVEAGPAHVTVLLWRPEANLRAWVLRLDCVGFRDQIQIVRLGSKSPYLLNHLSGPKR